jgi:hypothetical protein
MDNILDNFEDETTLTETDIFTKIWLSPREVLKYIHENKYNKYVTVLLILSGIAKAFDNASAKNTGDNLSLWMLVVACIVGGALFGWISYYLYAALISWTGKWLKGQGDTSSLIRVLAYSSIPAIVALIFYIPQIIVYGDDLFKSNRHTADINWISSGIVYGSMALEFCLGILSVRLSVIAISEVQKFSIGKSILNIFLSALVIVIPIVILVLVFKAF